MSTLTHLSDAELDEVTGGGFFKLNIRDVNVAIVSQAAANVATDTYKTYQNISQGQSVYIKQYT